MTLFSNQQFESEPQICLDRSGEFQIPTRVNTVNCSDMEVKMKINYNVSAMLSNNALSNNDDLLAQSLRRLSSGLKINRAKDNPAGLAMAKRMNAQIESLSVANQNASDGVSIIETADGAMNEISEMLQRLNELSIKAATGTLSDNDRNVVQEEVAKLKDEITRITEVTEFNGQPIFDGTFALKGYTDRVDVKVNSYSEDTPANKVYNLNQLVLKKDTLPDGTEQITVDSASNPLGPDFPEDVVATVKDNLVTLSNSSGFEIKLDVTRGDFQPNPSAPAGTTATELDLAGLAIQVTGIGDMRLQVGANEGQVMEIDIPAVTLQNMGIDKIDVSTKEGALDSIDRVDGAIQYLSRVRGRLGAYQNRLESTINSLDVTSENMTASYSRIMDVDMAEEMTNYTTYQILTQAGTSMLAQANERPSQVLQLLQ